MLNLNDDNSYRYLKYRSVLYVSKEQARAISFVAFSSLF